MANRAGPATPAAAASCPAGGPLRVILEARRYANLDPGDPDYQKWTPWSVSLMVTRTADRVSGVLEMSGDGLRWRFDVAGQFDGDHCTMSLDTTNTHEDLAIRLRLGDAIAGEISSIDARWLLGSSLPARRR
jgi:hypothetical protein